MVFGLRRTGVSLYSGSGIFNRTTSCPIPVFHDAPQLVELMKIRMTVVVAIVQTDQFLGNGEEELLAPVSLHSVDGQFFLPVGEGIRHFGFVRELGAVNLVVLDPEKSATSGPSGFQAEAVHVGEGDFVLLGALRQREHPCRGAWAAAGRSCRL